MSYDPTHGGKFEPPPPPPGEPLAPTVAAQRALTAKPWRLASQFWVALFGGTLALTYVALANGKRLGMSEAKRNAILTVGLVMFVVEVIGISMVVSDLSTAQLAIFARNVKWVRTGASLLAYLAMLAIQKSAHRAFVTHYGESYDSLWSVGLAATMVGVIVETVFMTLLHVSIL